MKIPEFEMNEQAVTLLMENGPGNIDVKAFIMSQDNDFPPRIIVAYQTIDHDGEELDAGIEYPEGGIPMLPDELDLKDGYTPSTVAVRHLRRCGVNEASASFFHPGIWYEGYPHTNMRTGQISTRSFHLKGFTPEEEAAVYKAIIGKH